ncbi:MAG: hypothetical protein AAF658_03955, partial [Myxococcota bacterium]
FLANGPPPDNSDPKGQLEWLGKMVTALEATRDPQLKPLKKKVRDTLLRFQRAARAGKTPEDAAKLFERDVRNLQIDTYGVLLRALEQMRATVKVQVAQGGLTPDVNATELLHQLDEFTRNVRRLVSAMKRKDPVAEAEVRALFQPPSSAQQK